MFAALQQMTKGELSAYVWLLPVITEIARARGVGLYGYPKYLSDINFSTNEGNIEGKVTVDGQGLLTMNGAILPTNKREVMKSQSYSIFDRVPLVTTILMDPFEQGVSGIKMRFL